MVWCSNCAENIARPDHVEGKICCSLCGRVLDEDNFTQEPTFVKNAAGQSQLSGSFVRTVQNDYSQSRERILDEVYNGIKDMIYALGIDGGDSIARPSLAFYTIALERNFTRGRRRDQVQAACLYIACRENKKPYLLIEFSEYLRINVYVLGAVFLQLCKLLCLEEHPIVQKPVDPSLFIHRFTDRLFGGKKPIVSRTALHIVASMKRDWMQTGRKPSGLCGAALYISALSHGLKCSKSEIIEEFNIKAEEFEKYTRLNNSLSTGLKVSGNNELLCEHKRSGRPAYAHGLCESCFIDFIKLSGGLESVTEPPAFQRAEKQRLMAVEATGKNSEKLNSTFCPFSEQNNSEHIKFQEERNTKNVNLCDKVQPAECDTPGSTEPQKLPDDFNGDKFQGGDANFEVSENFSDIDDIEVNGYLHSEEEKVFKKIIWEEMNKEYLEELAAKEAAKKACEVNFDNCSEDVQNAHKLAAAAAAVTKSKKEKQ